MTRDEICESIRDLICCEFICLEVDAVSMRVGNKVEGCRVTLKCSTLTGAAPALAAGMVHGNVGSHGGRYYHVKNLG